MDKTKWTGQRVREVSTSFISSLSLASNHWGRKGPSSKQGRAKGERGAVRVEVQDRGGGGGDGRRK